MLRIFLSGLLCATVLVPGIPALAQDGLAAKGSGTLESLLGYVPDTGGAREWLTYADYAAATSARGIEAFADFAEFDASKTDERTALWIASTPHGGMEMNYFTQFGRMPEMLGFDFFRIGQSLQWATPPGTGTILRGEFDEASIRAVHERRGFVETDLDGVPMWCSPDGCDKGLKQNLAARDPADLFGGDLGRKFPRALDGAFFFGSGIDAAVVAMRAASRDNTSILDDPAYRAVVQALDGDHFLRSVQFAQPSAFGSADLRRIGGEMDADKLRELMERFHGGDASLPVYELAAFADTAGATEGAHMTLVYVTPDMAESAAALLETRIRAAVSLAVDKSWMDLVQDRGGSLEPITVQSYPELRRWVVHITFSKALPDNQRNSETGRFDSAGMLYRLLYDGYLRRDLGWLYVGGL